MYHILCKTFMSPRMWSWIIQWVAPKVLKALWPPEHLELLSITSKKTLTFSNATVNTSNLIKLLYSTWCQKHRKLP
jgi:hypothetical protein